MAGNRFIEPHPQFLDANGDPLSSGTLTFYEAGGTSTLQAIYTDKDLSVAESNPLTLDAGGYLPNSLFLQQLSYNVVAKNSLAAEQWAEDDVSNILQVSIDGTPSVDTYAALTALLKASLTDGVTYRVLGRTTRGDIGPVQFEWVEGDSTTANAGTVLASGEGGTGRWLMRFSGSINVLWFNAKGDDSTDDSSAVQAAVDASGGIDLFFPTGTYIVDGLTSAVSSLFTLNSGATIKHKASAAAAMLISSDDIEIHGGTLDGNKANQTNRIDILQHDGGKFVMNRVDFQNSVSAACDIRDCSDICSITDNRFSGMAEHSGIAGETSVAIRVAQDTNPVVVKIEGNDFIGATPSVAGRAPGGIIVSSQGAGESRIRVANNYFFQLGQYAQSNFIGPVYLYTDADETIVSNNVFVDSFFGPIGLENSNNVVCTGNTIEGLDSGALGVGAIAWAFARTFNETIERCVIANNVIDINANTTNTCVVVSGNSGGTWFNDHCSITGNVMVGGNNGITQQYANHVNISGNIFAGQNSVGIQFEDLLDTASHVNITGNSFSDIGDVHIQGAAADNMADFNCTITGNLFDATAGTPAYFVQLQGESGAMMERVVISGNTAKGTASTFDWQITWCDTVVVVGNISDGGTDDLSIANSTLVREVGNSWQSLIAYTRTAGVVESRTLLASASATTLNNNNVLAALIEDLQLQGIIS